MVQVLVRALDGRTYCVQVPSTAAAETLGAAAGALTAAVRQLHARLAMPRLALRVQQLRGGGPLDALPPDTHLAADPLTALLPTVVATVPLLGGKVRFTTRTYPIHTCYGGRRRRGGYMSQDSNSPLGRQRDRNPRC
jgi:hypothetical protein